MDRQNTKTFLDQVLSLKEMREISLDLKPGDIVFCTGELGAGKTTFVTSQIRKLIDKDVQVTSPTYTYYQQYGENIFHFDLYRCESYEDVIRIGAEEILDRDDMICFVEWPEVLGDRYEPVYRVSLGHGDDDNLRNIEIKRLKD